MIDNEGSVTVITNVKKTVFHKIATSFHLYSGPDTFNKLALEQLQGVAKQLGADSNIVSYGHCVVLVIRNCSVPGI